MTPEQQLRGLLDTLRTAEEHRYWDLYAETLRMLHDGGVKVGKFGPDLYIAES